MDLEANSYRIYAVGRTLWSAALHPSKERLRKRMSHPQPGDLVIEVSGFGGPFDPAKVGTLISVEGTDPEWPESYLVAALHNGVEHRWGNATFVALPAVWPDTKWTGENPE